MAFLVKAAVVLLPVPTAYFTGAPPEIMGAAIYCTFVTLGLFLALAEIAGSVRRLADAVDWQRLGS